MCSFAILSAPEGFSHCHAHLALQLPIKKFFLFHLSPLNRINPMCKIQKFPINRSAWSTSCHKNRWQIISLNLCRFLFTFSQCKSWAALAHLFYRKDRHLTQKSALAWWHPQIHYGLWSQVGKCHIPLEIKGTALSHWAAWMRSIIKKRGADSKKMQVGKDCDY